MAIIVPESEKRQGITPEMDRRNGWLYIWVTLLVYFSAPVVYVDVVQAAFCDKLGASATVANLPSSIYLLGALFPIVCSWIFPARLEKRIVEICYLIVALSMLFICLIVFVPFSSPIRIAAVIGQGLVMGILGSVISLYIFKCLARGTTEKGRTRALKYAFGFGPIAAVLGSLTAQLSLDNKIPGLSYPYNFGALYLVALPCMILCSILSSRFTLTAVPEEVHPPFLGYLGQCAKGFVQDRRLVLTWLAYLFWCFTIYSMSNLSLYTREAIGRTPLELAGLIMALRFGCKALAGFGLGSLATRYGTRSALITTVVLVGAGIIWPLFFSGYWYLFAFGLMGAGELGQVYFFNYTVDISAPVAATRNLALMVLVSPLSSVAPAIYGGLTDWLGFRASFIFGTTTAALALGLLLLNGRRRVDPAGQMAEAG
ncbi:MAG: hypothetical protein EXS39_01585 [Opitutaceae bacterium]|nr:hypothetical protein [Opitutaceae bacterium]